jgi:CubicO group peptidase (beta-lactamase class C family)
VRRTTIACGLSKGRRSDFAAAQRLVIAVPACRVPRRNDGFLRPRRRPVVPHGGNTRFPGPLLPPPKLAASEPTFSIPDSSFEGLSFADDTSFAIQASVGGVNVFKHEYSAPGREVEQPLYETKFRVGSVTKTFTMLAVLLSADKMSMDDPITKFIPELNQEAYGKVTIGALASHTSGLGRYVSSFVFRA